jgi:acetyl esterase/lipase
MRGGGMAHRHIYPPSKPPSDGVYRPVHINEFVKGEFVCYSPSMKAERRHGRRHVRVDGDRERDKVENNTTIAFFHGGGFCLGTTACHTRCSSRSL